MENNFKGNHSTWVLNEELRTNEYGAKYLSIDMPDIKSMNCIDIYALSDEDEVKLFAEGQLVADAGNVRQQIDCSLPELLERYKKMEEALLKLMQHFEWADGMDVDDPEIVGNGEALEVIYKALNLNK